MKCAIHVCLVSDQPIPNLIPVLDEAIRPSRVILLVSRDKGLQGRWLSEVINGVGCAVDVHPIDPYSFEEARSAVDRLLDQLSEADVVLNATGGTKIMALAAFDAFRAKRRPVIYVDTHNRQVLHLFPARDPVSMSNVLTVEAYLKSYGYAIQSQRTDLRAQAGSAGIGQALAAHPNCWDAALKTLTGIAGRAQKSLEGSVGEDQRAVPGFSELVALFEAGGFVRDEGDRLRFPHEPGRMYVNGGWLEEHVFHALWDLRDELGIVSLKANMEVQSATGVQNELLDVACTAGNRLHLIECKTGGVGADVTYKINTLNSMAGGTFGKAMLISFHPLKGEHAQRCSDLKIARIDGSGLKQLKERLAQWVQPL